MLNKLIVSPPSNSREMKAYMQAILEVTGLVAGERFDISLFMRNYRTHLDNGRLRKHADGTYSLTDPGRAYFASRLAGDPARRGQELMQEEVLRMRRSMTASDPALGWIRIGVRGLREHPTRQPQAADGGA